MIFSVLVCDCAMRGLDGLEINCARGLIVLLQGSVADSSTGGKKREFVNVMECFPSWEVPATCTVALGGLN
jgi:hypothetical protein